MRKNIPPKPRARRPDKEHEHLLLHEIKHLLEHIMATQTEIVATLQRAAAKQEKTIAEIGTLQGTVTELKAEVVTLKDLVAAGGEVSQELIDSANRVETLAGQADDQIPDVEPIPSP